MIFIIENPGMIRQANLYRPTTSCEESLRPCLPVASGTALSEASSQTSDDAIFTTKRDPAVEPQYRRSRSAGMPPPTRPAIEQGPGIFRALSSLHYPPSLEAEYWKAKGLA